MASFCHRECVWFSSKADISPSLLHNFLSLLFYFSLSLAVSLSVEFSRCFPRYFTIDPAGWSKELCKARFPQDMDRVLQLQALILCSMPCLLFRCFSKALRRWFPPLLLLLLLLGCEGNSWRKSAAEKTFKPEINEEKREFDLYFCIWTRRKCQ